MDIETEKFHQHGYINAQKSTVTIVKAYFPPPLGGGDPEDSRRCFLDDLQNNRIDIRMELL